MRKRGVDGFRVLQSEKKGKYQTIMLQITLDMYQTLAAAVVVLALGRFLRGRVRLLERFCIPAPVIGGVLFAIFTCVCYGTGIAEFAFDDILKEVCMVFFFTSVGFQANLKVLRSGGTEMIVFLVLVIASNSYFVQSIVDPILKINTIAKEIAAGRYGVRLQKTYDDEIGELCDTINYMSDEINRAERMKNDFISSVSHELRTPLTAIGGWSETLLAGGGEDPEEVMQGLTIIQKEAGRLTRMVEELLDFARIESGRMKLEVENFDLSIELYEAVYMYENLLRKSGIRLNYDEDVEANYFVNGDRHRMKQVFLNILDNAAKYGGDGKRIDIRLVRDGGNLVATVRDYGQGIPEAELPFVKEKFYKGSSKQRGSGIGLAVTEEIVVLHGGTLDIASAVGEGTTVTVTLPSAKAEEALGITGAPSRTEEEP